MTTMKANPAVSFACRRQSDVRMQVEKFVKSEERKMMIERHLRLAVTLQFYQSGGR